MDMKQALFEVITLAEESIDTPKEAAGDKDREEIMMQENLAVEKVRELYKHLFATKG